MQRIIARRNIGIGDMMSISFIIVLSILFIIAKEKITSFKFKLLLDNEKREKENIENYHKQVWKYPCCYSRVVQSE